MRIMKNVSYDEFWREKEKKYGGRFLYSAAKVTNGFGESGEVKAGSFKRFMRAMDAHNRLLLIDTIDNTEVKTHAFLLSENTLIFCRKIAPFLKRA